MKNILKFSSLLGVLFLFLTSCGSDDTKPVVIPEIQGIENMVKILEGNTESYKLTGGDGNITVKSQNTQIASATLDGNTLIITGVSGGTTNVTIEAGSKTKVVEVRVVGKTMGVYKNGDLAVTFTASVKNKNGVWFLEKSGNPYDGKRLHVSTLPANLEVGKTVNVDIKSYGIDGVNTGAQPTVDVISSDIVGLKFGEVLIVLPRK